jgi:hypothetical protein
MTFVLRGLDDGLLGILGFLRTLIQTRNMLVAAGQLEFLPLLE